MQVACVYVVVRAGYERACALCVLCVSLVAKCVHFNTGCAHLCGTFLCEYNEGVHEFTVYA